MQCWDSVAQLAALQAIFEGYDGTLGGCVGPFGSPIGTMLDDLGLF